MDWISTGITGDKNSHKIILARLGIYVKNLRESARFAQNRRRKE